MHAANPDKSERLSRMLRVLKAHPHGLTTAELQTWTKSCAVATDISELRQSGHTIRRQYMYQTEGGRHVNRYFYEGKSA
jgi:predicted DNA-binding transcriptional regulator YafY